MAFLHKQIDKISNMSHACDVSGRKSNAEGLFKVNYEIKMVERVPVFHVIS